MRSRTDAAIVKLSMDIIAVPSESAQTSVKVVIIEDDHVTRANLCAAVEASEGFLLAASFGELKPALAWMASHSFDMLLTDLGLPDGSGIDAISFSRERWPSCDVMVVTMFGDEKNVLASIEAGAAGYILKDGDHLDVSRAMHALRNGGSPMSPFIARKVLERALRKPDVASPASKPPMPAVPIAPAVTLTKREAETLDLIARGYTYEEVARLLAISLSTVRTHIRGIYGKLTVNSRGEAVFEAHKLGLLQDGLLKP